MFSIVPICVKCFVLELKVVSKSVKNLKYYTYLFFSIKDSKQDIVCCRIVAVLVTCFNQILDPTYSMAIDKSLRRIVLDQSESTVPCQTQG